MDPGSVMETENLGAPVYGGDTSVVNETYRREVHRVLWITLVLNLLVAEYLYQRFPGADEGVLSRRRASLVSGATSDTPKKP